MYDKPQLFSVLDYTETQKPDCFTRVDNCFPGKFNNNWLSVKIIHDNSLTRFTASRTSQQHTLHTNCQIELFRRIYVYFYI